MGSTFAYKVAGVLDSTKKWMPGPLRKQIRRALGGVRQQLLNLWARGLAKERIWLFSAWEGHSFSDNPKHLFIHVATKHPEIRAVWVSRDPAVVAHVRSRGFAAELSFTTYVDALTLAAEAIVFSDTPAGLGARMTHDVVLVNLWHGMPMKDIGAHHVEFDLLIATCPETRDLLARVFSVHPEKIVVSGEPKNDALFGSMPKPPALQKWGSDVKVVSYIPTYRGTFQERAISSRSNTSGIFLDACLFGALRTRFESLLQQHNAIFVIKPHVRNRMRHVDNPRVVVIDEFSELGNLDSHELMSVTDLLITDYSSVYFSFLLLDRPFILYTPDLDTYLREQRLYYDISELSAGFQAFSEEMLLDQVGVLLSNPQVNAEARVGLRNRFHAYQDGRSCERVFDAVCERISRRGRGGGRASPP